MGLRPYSVLLLLFSACATAPSPQVSAPHNLRLSNLQRAAQYPWTDDGRCVVKEASHPWAALAKSCFHALDTEKVRFQDVTGQCALASAGAAVLGVGVCIFAAPEIIIGAVIITGVVVVAVAIHEELEAHARWRRAHPEPEASTGSTEPVTEGAPEEPHPERRPVPQGPLGPDWIPPLTDEPSERRPECTPKRVPPKGGHTLHNRCADDVPLNAFRGANALVNGKAYDALQPVTRTLWEVKTTAIETYSTFVRAAELDKQIREARRERALAEACGYEFRLGVRTEAHRALLEAQAPDLEGLIVIMDWC